MDAQGGSANVVQVEAPGCRESKIIAAARMRSTDYEPIIEDTVAGLGRNAPDKRHKVYAHARSVVMRHLLLMRLPESIFEFEKLALDLAIKNVERRWRARDNLPERRIKPSGTATSSIAARVLRRLVSPTGIAVALPVIAVMIFFGLRNSDKVTHMSAAGDVVERWFSVHDGEPTASVDARDGLAGRRSTRAAPSHAALTAETAPPSTTMMATACDPGSSMSERNACARNTPVRATAVAALKTENEPPWVESFSAFGDMTSGWGPASALSGPVVTAEDFSVRDVTPYASQAFDAAPMSLEAPAPAAPPQATLAPLIRKPVSAEVAALIASGKQANLKGDLDRAVRDFSEAIRIDPKYADAYLERGQTFFKLGDTQRAIADYSAALAHDPQHGAALRTRGMAHLYLGKTDLALADLSKAIELGESDPRLLAPIELFYARRSRGSIYESTQQYDLEIADCTALIESYTHDPMLAEALAANYGSAGATNILARTYLQRASAFVRRSSVERAVADLTQAIPLSSDRGYTALIDRSRLHEGLGRNDLAAADARAALNIRPGSEEARLALSRLSAFSNTPPPNGL